MGGVIYMIKYANSNHGLVSGNGKLFGGEENQSPVETVAVEKI